jgi:putative hemolysin
VAEEWLWFLIVVFAVGSLFFSLTSMALRQYSRVRLQEAFEAIGKAGKAEELVENGEALLLSNSFCRLFCNSAVILLLVYVFVARPADIEMHSGYIIAFGIAILAMPVIALAVPHPWAKYNGERVLARTYGVLVFVAWLSKPMLYLFSFYDHVIRRLAGVPDTNLKEAEEEREEEFLNVVEQGRMEGIVDEEEQEMIENVLELSDKQVGEIMTPRTDVVAVNVDAGLTALLATMIEEGHSKVPVYEGTIDNIVGIIYSRDMLTEIGKGTDDFAIRSRMREVYFVPETKPLRSLLREFQQQKLQIAVVLDEYGGTAGVITVEDIMEELVGDIADEFDDTEPENIHRIDARTIEADARVYIDDLNKDYELDLPDEEDYDTLGGFVFSHLGYIPKAGESFEYSGLKFVISAAEPRRVKRIRIENLSGEMKAQ